MKSKVIIAIFIAVVLLIATLGVVQSNSAINKTLKIEQQTNPSAIDSIIDTKVDFRFTSYDNKFMYENIVVINEAGRIIGKLILYTNNKEVDSFYSIDENWRKTRLYKKLMNQEVRILEK